MHALRVAGFHAFKLHRYIQVTSPSVLCRVWNLTHDPVCCVELEAGRHMVLGAVPVGPTLLSSIPFFTERPCVHARMAIGGPDRLTHDSRRSPLGPL